MIYLLILFPLLMAALTFAWPTDRGRPWLVALGALGIDLGDLPVDANGNPASDLANWIYSKPTPVTLNTPGNPGVGSHLGPNNFQNFPVLTSTIATATGTTIRTPITATADAPTGAARTITPPPAGSAPRHRPPW